MGSGRRWPASVTSGAGWAPPEPAELPHTGHLAVGAYILVSIVWAIFWLLLTPADLLAWGPGTHVAIGQGVLQSAHLLPPAIRSVLERHRVPFLYGSVAADISFAKKYADVGRHSHHWHVGEEILASADTEELHAVGLGYLAHLAADTVAHNLYVPRRLLLTRTTQAVGHTYWEHRMDVQLGDRFVREARRVVLHHDHDRADELFDQVLSSTLFSFRTNRRIFRGMIAFQDADRWKKVFDEILRRSRFDLPLELRDQYVRLAFDYVMERLAEGHSARARALDPIGDANLKMAKKIRREALAASRGREDPDQLLELAGDYFPLPGEPLLYVPRTQGIEVPGLSTELASGDEGGGGREPHRVDPLEDSEDSPDDSRELWTPRRMGDK